MFFENPEAEFLCIHSIFCNSLIMMKSKFKHKEKWEHYTQTEMKINTFNYPIPFSKTMMVLGTALLTNSARLGTEPQTTQPTWLPAAPGAQTHPQNHHPFVQGPGGPPTNPTPRTEYSFFWTAVTYRMLMSPWSQGPPTSPSQQMTRPAPAFMSDRVTILLSFGFFLSSYHLATVFPWKLPKILYREVKPTATSVTILFLKVWDFTASAPALVNYHIY